MHNHELIFTVHNDLFMLMVEALLFNTLNSNLTGFEMLMMSNVCYNTMFTV